MYYQYIKLFSCALLVQFAFLSGEGHAKEPEVIHIIGAITKIEDDSQARISPSGNAKKVQVKILVEHIEQASKNVYRNWFVRDEISTYAFAEYVSEDKNPAWLSKAILIRFFLLPLEHTKRFQIVAAETVNGELDPSDEEILNCQDNLDQIKKGMTRDNLDQLGLRNISGDALYKSEKYISCRCDQSSIWARTVWFRPVAMPKEVYWTTDGYYDWLEKSKSGHMPRNDDVVMEISDLDCIPITLLMIKQSHKHLEATGK